MAVRKQLPEELRGIVTLAYWTGWRVASEILALRWSQVDRAKQLISLEPRHDEEQGRAHAAVWPDRGAGRGDRHRRLSD